MKSNFNLVVIGFCCVLFSCQESQYEKLVREEMAKGIRMDSLIWGIEFNDTRTEFFGKCWEMNKKGKIVHGPNNQNVQYNIKDSEGSDIRLLFYPEFDSTDRIKKMDMSFSYEGWSEWNTHLSAKNLLPIVIDTLESWYGGNEFIKVQFDDGIKDIYVKVDGNRRISMHAEHKRDVLVKIVDMLNEENK